MSSPFVTIPGLESFVLRPADTRAIRAAKPAVFRKRSSDQWFTADVSWVMTDEQYGVFREEYKTLSNGNDWFALQTPVNDPPYFSTVRFKEGFSASKLGYSGWRVSGVLELFDQEIFLI